MLPLSKNAESNTSLFDIICAVADHFFSMARDKGICIAYEEPHINPPYLRLIEQELAIGQ